MSKSNIIKENSRQQQKNDLERRNKLISGRIMKENIYNVYVASIDWNLGSYFSIISSFFLSKSLTGFWFLVQQQQIKKHLHY